MAAPPVALLAVMALPVAEAAEALLVGTTTFLVAPVVQGTFLAQAQVAACSYFGKGE